MDEAHRDTFMCMAAFEQVRRLGEVYEASAALRRGSGNRQHRHVLYQPIVGVGPLA